jgi:hypothetical protein
MNQRMRLIKVQASWWVNSLEVELAFAVNGWTNYSVLIENGQWSRGANFRPSPVYYLPQPQQLLRHRTWTYFQCDSASMGVDKAMADQSSHPWNLFWCRSLHLTSHRRSILLQHLWSPVVPLQKPCYSYSSSPLKLSLNVISRPSKSLASHWIVKRWKLLSTPEASRTRTAASLLPIMSRFPTCVPGAARLTNSRPAILCDVWHVDIVCSSRKRLRMGWSMTRVK